MVHATVRRDLEGLRIYDHRTGRYYGSDEVGSAMVHSSDDYKATVSVVTEAGFFLTFDSIDLEYAS